MICYFNSIGNVYIGRELWGCWESRKEDVFLGARTVVRHFPRRGEAIFTDAPLFLGENPRAAVWNRGVNEVVIGGRLPFEGKKTKTGAPHSDSNTSTATHARMPANKLTSAAAK